MLSARYGEEQGRLCFVGGRGSVWWQQLNTDDVGLHSVDNSSIVTSHFEWLKAVPLKINLFAWCCVAFVS